MTDTTEKIAALEAAADRVSGWSNCNQAWLDTSEDTACAVVGHIDDDGETYPAAVVDCDQYGSGGDSLHLARFYAATNPATILDLIAHIRQQEAELATLRDQIKRAEEQEPVWCSAVEMSDGSILYDHRDTPIPRSDAFPLYTKEPK